MRVQVVAYRAGWKTRDMTSSNHKPEARILVTASCCGGQLQSPAFS